MTLTDFTKDQIEEAAALALANYEEERQNVSILPNIDVIPDLTCFADNGLGVAAFVEGIMVGFLCWYNPTNVITAKARGVFSPIHAHGAILKNREKIYMRLYQAAAEKWALQDVSWHSIALYSHDKQAINAHFTYGFGLRCIDAIRPMEKIECQPSRDYSYYELSPEDKNKLLPLKNMLITHLGKSPTFLYYPPETETGLESAYNHRKSRYFCASQSDSIIAFIEITDGGENFACDDPSMKNICGALCMPEHRGHDVYQNLLNYTISVLKGEGYTRLGVDFESFNPTAYSFWLKYFTAYTKSVVRRIDEKVMDINIT